MNLHQIVWLIILAPMFLVIGIIELSRAKKILIDRKISLNLSVRIRIWLIKNLRGEKKAKIYERTIKENATRVHNSGIYSAVGGLLYLLGGVFFAWLLLSKMIQ